MKKQTPGITDAVAVVSHFKQSISFRLVRFGPRQFGFVCEQTGKKMFLTWKTRLDAAVGITARYFVVQADKDSALVNPKLVATTLGIGMSLDLLLAAGFVRIEGAGSARRAVTVR